MSVFLSVCVSACVCYLVFDAVPSKHVFDVVQEVTDGVHIGQVFTMLVHSLKHLIKCHSNLREEETHTSHDIQHNTGDHSIHSDTFNHLMMVQSDLQRGQMTITMV